MRPLYSIKPRSRKRFIKELIRERVVPIIPADSSGLMTGGEVRTPPLNRAILQCIRLIVVHSEYPVEFAAKIEDTRFVPLAVGKGRRLVRLGILVKALSSASSSATGEESPIRFRTNC